MTLRLSATFLVCCSLVLPQSVPSEPGRSANIGSDTQGQNLQSLQRRFPPEIQLSTPTENFARAMYPDIQTRLRNLWVNELQGALVRLSTRGRQVVLEDSGHLVQFERADAVISAVREVWLEASAGSRDRQTHR